MMLVSTFPSLCMERIEIDDADEKLVLFVCNGETALDMFACVYDCASMGGIRVSIIWW